jgi:alginate O-acetyltransferase complex protein AlgJ
MSTTAGPLHVINDREAIARRDLGHTAVSPPVTRLLVGTFLLLISLVPIVEIAADRSRATSNDAVVSTWSHLAHIPSEVRTAFRSVTESTATPSRWQRVLAGNRRVLAGTQAFERALEHDSMIGRALRPQAQLLLTSWLHAGNERVYPGRDGWLFYRPDVEYITGRGFLDRAQLARRRAAGSEVTTAVQPDPRPAITAFHRQLAVRGITLIVVPTPVKPSVHPQMLSRGSREAGVLQNPSYGAFIDDLAREGVLVFNPSTTLAAARADGPQYLRTDTHWRPEAMELVAERLAGFLAGHVQLSAVADPEYRIDRVELRNSGDAARMLDLPAHARLLSAEAVFLRRVLLPDGSAWRPSRTADVLVLGDSFSNIYTLESMGWGTSAGFVEQLSYTLRRPLDRIVQNDEGAFATRATLARDPERLAGKRVVIYQFASRELVFGDWR